MLEIRLFGSPQFLLNAQPLPRLIHSPILTKLVSFLALHVGRPVARPVLAAQLWPDIPEATARQYLDTHLCRLRHCLDSAGPIDFLLCCRDVVEWNVNAPFWLDVDEFARAASSTPDAADADTCIPKSQPAIDILEHAVDLYCGDFMEGFYDDWCLCLREHYREQHLLMLGAISQAYLSRGQYPAALDYALRLVETEPTCENAHQGLIQLYLLLGKLGDARQQYERYCYIWREELDIGPSAKMQALAKALRADTTAPLESTLSVAVNAEKQTLARLFDAVAVMPDSLASQSGYQLHTSLWPVAALHLEHLARLQKLDGSVAEAELHSTLAAQIRCSLDGTTRCQNHFQELFGDPALTFIHH